MNSKQKTGIALMAIVFGLAISPALVSNDAEARFSVPQATLQGLYYQKLLSKCTHEGIVRRLTESVATTAKLTPFRIHTCSH